MALEQSDIDAIVSAVLDADPRVYAIRGAISGDTELDEGDTLTLTFTPDESSQSVASELAKVAAIAVKTELIGTGSATVAAPVTESGALTDLVIGDDYSASNGQALSWTVDLPTGATVGGASCYFGGEHSDPSLAEDNSWLIQGTVSEGPTASQAVITFSLLRSHTADLIPGDYNWSAEIRNDAGLQSTKVRSKKTRRVTLVEKQT